MRNISLADAKARLTIYEIWRLCDLRGQPGKSCHSPWREDRNASFSISPDGKLWHDFATGEGGDAVDFLQRATGLSNTAGCREFIELAGGSIALPPAARPRAEAPLAKTKPNFPLMECGSDADLHQLSILRSIGPEGLRLAQRRGVLRFATLRGHRAWIITDGERLNAQARRLEGQRWDHLPDRPKAWTLPGSWGAWTIGAKEARQFSAIALCEGGPDLLAAFFFIYSEQRTADCTAVAILGASNSIHAGALPGFAGKRIRIFCHTDDAGRAAAEKWAYQFEDAGADVDAFSFDGLRKTDGSRVEDLNDVTQIDPNDFEENPELWSLMP